MKPKQEQKQKLNLRSWGSFSADAFQQYLVDFMGHFDRSAFAVLGCPWVTDNRTIVQVYLLCSHLQQFSPVEPKLSAIASIALIQGSLQFEHSALYWTSSARSVGLCVFSLLLLWVEPNPCRYPVSILRIESRLD